MIQEQLNSANVKCQYVILSLYYFPCSRYFSSSFCKCDFRVQWETNHLGLIIILPVSCLFFALQEIDLWMSLNSLRMTFLELRTNRCWGWFRLTKLTGVTEQALACDMERPISLLPLRPYSTTVPALIYYAFLANFLCCGKHFNNLNWNIKSLTWGRLQKASRCRQFFFLRYAKI